MEKKKKKKKKISVGEKIFNSLTSITFKHKGVRYKLDIGGELLVDGEEDLASQIEKIPAIIGYFGSVVAMLSREFEDKKALKKKVEAKIDERIRKEGIIGETRIDKAIKRDPEWIKACVAVNKAEERASRAKSLLFSLRDKKVVLLSRSADIRGMPSDALVGVSRDEIINFDNYD